jgi:hypothetical protein
LSLKESFIIIHSKLGSTIPLYTETEREETAMKKIVLKGHSEKNRQLVRILEDLFPECEIDFFLEKDRPENRIGSVPNWSHPGDRD